MLFLIYIVSNIKLLFYNFRSFLCELNVYVKELGRSKIFRFVIFCKIYIGHSFPVDHREFLCILFFSLLAINAREHGSNKQMASKSCALSLVRQLYHLQVIEPYTGITKKKETDKVVKI